MKKVGKITNTWKKALQFIKAKDTENAVEQLDTCLLILAQATEAGETIIDNLRVDLWKMRVWVKIEDLGPYGDEIGLSPMLVEDWGRFSDWLNTFETDFMWSLEELVELYERNNPKIQWWIEKNDDILK